MFSLSACDNVDNVKKVPAPSSVIFNNGKVVDGGDCAKLSPWGFPQPSSGETSTVKQFICHDDFAAMYNSSSGVSEWIVEKITPEKINSDYPYIEENFRPDPALHDDDEISPSEYDFGNTKNWQKGMMTGVGDYKYARKSQSQSYYMTNVAPMNEYLYDNVYGVLNKNIRNWARSYGDLYVITGAIYYGGKPLDYVGNHSAAALVVSGNNARIGETSKARIAVPTHYFKVIFSPKLKQAMAFIIPNQPFTVNALGSYKTSVKNIELISGYNFFPQFPQSFANTIDNEIANWPIYDNISEN